MMVRRELIVGLGRKKGQDGQEGSSTKFIGKLEQASCQPWWRVSGAEGVD